MNIGDYVRTKYGIGKIIETRIFLEQEEIKLDSNTGKITQVNDNSHWNNKEDIIKSSPNIRDLIKAGDIARYIYKNKEYISKIIDRGTLMLEITGDMEVSLGLVEIKSIVTKEQFSQMEYKIGE